MTVGYHSEVIVSTFQGQIEGEDTTYIVGLAQVTSIKIGFEASASSNLQYC